MSFRNFTTGKSHAFGGEYVELVAGGRMRYTMPAIVLLVPGAKALTIGVPDFRFSWLGKVRDFGTPDYVVGAGDWLTLVERSAARPRLTIGPG